MMAEPVDPALVRRLESLSGDAVCCVEDFQAVAADARRDPAFDEALARAKALADPNRLLAAAVIKRRGEACACEVQAALGVTHATVSHHMAQLARAGIVLAERRGKWVHYRIAPEMLPLIP